MLPSALTTVIPNILFGPFEFSSPSIRFSPAFLCGGSGLLSPTWDRRWLLAGDLDKDGDVALPRPPRFAFASFVGGFSAPVLLARLCCFANDSEPSSNDAALVPAPVLVPALALVPMPVLVPVLVLVLVLMPLRTLDP